MASNELLLNLVRLMARTYRQTLAADEAAVYAEWCKGIPESELEGVFREAMEASPSFMPTGPAISALWKNRASKTDTLLAEQEWDRVQRHVLAYGVVCDPHGWTYDGVPLKLELSSAAEYALRQIGGTSWRQAVQNADDERLHWLRTNFLEIYGRYAETGGFKALSQKEAQAMFNDVLEFRKKLLAEATDYKEDHPNA